MESKEIEAMLKHTYALCKKNEQSLKEIRSILEYMHLIVQDSYLIVQADSMSGFHECEGDDRL